MKANSPMIQIPKRTALALLCLAVLVVLAAGAYRLIRAWENASSQIAVPPDAAIFPGYDRTVLQIGDQSYRLKDGLETVLLLGIDKFQAEAQSSDTYRNDQQADFLTVLILDHQAKTCTPLQLNRDTMADIPVLGVGGKPAGTVRAQLALAHTYGSGGERSCENTADAVSRFLCGMKIDHYVALTMDAVAVLNDAVGGVTVEIQDDFSAVDPALVQGETVRLRGEQALTFVRARGSLDDSSNLSRMARQQAFAAGLYPQLQAALAADPGLPTTLLTELGPSMVSDLDLEEWASLLQAVGGYAMEDVREIAGEAVLGEPYMEFHADEDALQTQLIQLFCVPDQE